jgi:hypothetical protein
MKIFIIALFIVSLTFYSCKKCATCTRTTTTTTTNSTPKVMTTTFDACGKELKDFDGENVSATSTSNGITTTVTIKTTCK